MIIAGLTGSIAMGKSETARMFRELGVPVFDADAAVHDLYKKGGAGASLVGAEFPSAVVDGVVDRNALSKLVLGNDDAIARLEKIVHPLVRKARQEFLKNANADGQPLVVLDIPLLFETGYDGEIDKVIVVSAPAEIQRERALARPGMTAEKLEQILGRQVPDAEKRKKADFVVDSSRGLEHAFEQVEKIVQDLAPSVLVPEKD
ncbi:MAG: dephospho-CoA kinase [Hyphomicrobiales bacterium]